MSNYYIEIKDREGVDLVNVGGAKTKKPRPIVETSRFAWGRKPVEAKIELREVGDGVYSEQNGRVDFQTDDWKYSTYKINGNSLELELILFKKPTKNKFEWQIDMPGLRWLYQPGLRVKEDPRAVRSTGTELFDKNNNVISYCPENVVGSYAVYHNNPSSIINSNRPKEEKRWGGGKAFHVYRPLIKDASGRKIWGKLDFNKKRKILSVTIPKKWLGAAKYPVSIDPTFGYETIGGAATILDTDYVVVGGPHTISDRIDVSDVSYYAKANTGTNYAKMVIYDDPHTDSNSLLALSTEDPVNTTLKWWNHPLVVFLNPDDYYLGLICKFKLNLYRDSGDGTYTHVSGAYVSPPDSFSGADGSGFEWSIYATYTVHPGGFPVQMLT